MVETSFALLRAVRRALDLAVTAGDTGKDLGWGWVRLAGGVGGSARNRMRFRGGALVGRGRRMLEFRGIHSEVAWSGSQVDKYKVERQGGVRVTGRGRDIAACDAGKTKTTRCLNCGSPMNGQHRPANVKEGRSEDTPSEAVGRAELREEQWRVGSVSRKAGHRAQGSAVV